MDSQIDVKEFVKLFTDLGSTYKLPDIDIFIKTVLMNYDLVRLQTYKGINDLNVPDGPLLKIPPQYGSTPLNYFIVKDFFTFYLAPLLERQSIIKSGQAIEIKKFIIEGQNNESNLIVEEEQMEVINKSIPTLLDLFSEIGKLLLVKFQKNDFLNA